MERKISLFGPLLLIALGAIWILVSSHVIPTSNLWALTHIWPYLLIVAGLGLILRSYWKYAPILVDVLIIGGAVLAIFYAPQLKWDTPLIISMSDNSFDFGSGQPGSGNVVTDNRNVSGILGINIDYPAQVFISQGDTESVKIEAEDNVLPGLQTQVRGDTLNIFYKAENGKNINPTKPVKITIVVKDLEDVQFPSAGELTITGLKTEKLNLSLSGAGSIKMNNITVTDLFVTLSGAGSVTASGTADNIDMNISGFGSFNGGDLHSKTANIALGGAGSATTWVDDQLDVDIAGAGSVNYYGSAKVSQRISGLGSVNRLGNK